MWGDYHNTLDPSHPNYQNQKDKLISQAKLIAGITAVITDKDANVASEMAAEAVRWNSSYPNYGSMSKNQQAECRQLGISTSDCGKYHGKKNLETLRQIGLFIIPTTPEEIAIAVVTGGAGRYVVKAGGKVISKVFKSKDEAQKALDKAQELAKSDIEDKVKENISNSQTARQSSGYGQFSQTADNISALKELNVKQLDRKFKHAVDFGIVTTKKNTQTINRFGEAIKAHMRSPDTVQFGTYGFIPDSKVFYNKVLHNIVVITKDGGFSTGFRLKPGTPQYENFFKNGVLR